MRVTLAKLKEILRYDPETGLCTWLVNRGPVKAGDIADSRGSKGYVVIKIDGRKYYAHVLASFYMTGRWPRRIVDHKNLKKADNAWSNLRPATDSQNQVNKPLCRRNTSGHKGVNFHKETGKWRAEIYIDNRCIHLGLFASKELAIDARIRKS